MGILFFVGRKVGKAKKAGKDNKGTTLYALYALYALPRSADAYDEPIFRHTKGEVRSILNVCEELRLAV